MVPGSGAEAEVGVAPHAVAAALTVALAQVRWWPVGFFVIATKSNGLERIRTSDLHSLGWVH